MAHLQSKLNLDHFKCNLYPMKSLHFLNIISVIAILGLNTRNSSAQIIPEIARGTAPGELIVNCSWYEMPILISKYGNIYTANHGQDVAFYADSLFFILVGDQTPGLIYGINPSNSNYIVRSFDNGFSWDTTKFYHYKNIYGGSRPAELFALGNIPPYDVLYLSSDSGATFTVCYENIPFVSQTITAGPLAGQCYSLTNNYVINFTTDYWQSYQSYPIDTSITSEISGFITMMAGGGDRELYLVSEKSENDTLLLNIYRSTDHGQSFTLQYTWNNYQPWNYKLAFVTGREPGAFYIIKGSYEWDYTTEISSTILEFYYSSDGGVTYNHYYHNLYNEFFTGVKPLPSAPSITLSPNPATTAVWLQNLPEGETITAIEISNLSGQCVFSCECSPADIRNQSLRLEIPQALAAGCYVVKVLDKKALIFTNKLLVVK